MPGDAIEAAARAARASCVGMKKAHLDWASDDQRRIFTEEALAAIRAYLAAQPKGATKEQMLEKLP